MHERSILWDIAIVGLLGLIAVLNLLTVIQNERMEARLIRLEQAGPRVVSAAPATVAPASVPVVITPVSGRLFDGSDVPKFVRGDENADDGGRLLLNARSEPNSLNPLIDNDATASDLFGRANDNLVGRAFDDFKYWEPRLARAWEKAMICRGLARDKKARDLAAKLNGALDAAAKQRLCIARIEAENDEVLRLELGDVNGAYREEVLKALGADAIEKQFWIYVTFDGDRFPDGKDITAASVGERLENAIKSAKGFAGRLLPRWERERSVVVRVVGAGDAAVKAVKDYVASDANKGEIADAKSATGKRVDKVLTYDLTEDYVFEEKPVFTFHLRKDVKWHDGTPFTGRDVVFSFNTVMNPKVEAAPQRNYLQDCESCTLWKDDPYIVQFVWRKPYFLAFNFAAGLDVLPEHVFKFDDPEQFNKGKQNQTLVGTGAYKLGRWERKQQFVFVRNEHYYGRKPHFDEIVYKLVDDPTVSLQLFEAGKLDVNALSKSQAKEKLKDEAFLKKAGINVSVAGVYRYIGWNARNPLFASTRVRRALTMLVDRQRIVNDVYRGFALPLNGPVHPDSPTYTPEMEKFAVPYDPAQAVNILNEEGWRDTDGDGVLDKNGVPFKFSLLFRAGSPEYESVGNLIKDSFAQAGLIVNPSNLEWSVLLQRLNRRQFDAVIIGWQLGLEDDPYQLWHSSQTVEKGSNHCYFVSKEADRMIEEGRRELDDARRTALFRKVYEIIAREQPYTFLLVEKRTMAYDRRIQNVVYKLPGSDMDRWWVPKQLQKQ
jgi:peptide/nickel transport system substrate-binding protein